MNFSLKKSFNKHIRRNSSSDKLGDLAHEELPILLDHNHHTNSNNDHHYHHAMMRRSSLDSPDRREVIVKIDAGIGANADRENDAGGSNNDNGVWRDSGYGFWKDGNRLNGGNAGMSGGSGGGDFGSRGRGQDVEDPPSKLIGEFLHMQQATGDVSLDMDLEMFGRNNNNGCSILTPVPESPTQQPAVTSKELRVSFQQSAPFIEAMPDSPISGKYRASSDEDDIRPLRRQPVRKSSNLAAPDGGGGEVLKCTSNASFQRKSTLMRIKTRSRLIDPPEMMLERRSGRVARSGPMKSGLLPKANEDEDDDPFFLEGDIPDDLKKANFSLLTLAQWVSLILILGALICSLSVPGLKKVSVWKLHLWKWEVMVLVLICGRLVSGWGIRMLVFFVERNFLLRKRVLYFVYGLRSAVQNCLWLGLVLIAWHLLFDEKVERDTQSIPLKYVTKILICFLVATLIWLLKTLMVKVLASSFHVSTYFDRIQESLFNQYVIETLSGPPLVQLRNAQDEEIKLEDEVRKLQNAGATMPPELRETVFPAAKSGRLLRSGALPPNIPAGKSKKFSRALSKKQQDGGITIDHLHRLSPKNVSAWNMKRLIKIVRHGSLSTLDEHIADSTTPGDESATQIQSENEAKAAARKIFHNVAKPGSKYIYSEDLTRFMQEDEVMKTISLFDGASESGRISKSSLKDWVVNSFRERRALALTLNDTKTAVNKLHQMVNVIVGIIIGIIWLLILGITTSKFFVLVSSQIVVAAFIFGNTLKTIFEALIFLFVIHPFDVGDRCEVDGIQMVVEEMNILTTVFLRYDNQKIVFLNSVLATKPIGNFYRSPDMGDSVDFSVHIATPPEKIASMRQRILSYIENKKEHWYSTPAVVLKDIEGLNRLKFAVWICHRMNHQNMGEKWTRRAVLVEEMVKIFRELDIEYRLHPLDINIRSMPSITSSRMP